MAGSDKELPVGVLTSENRDTWTLLRDQMLVSPVNKASLDAIETASFVLCLDDTAPRTRDQVSRACSCSKATKKHLSRLPDQSLSTLPKKNKKTLVDKIEKRIKLTNQGSRGCSKPSGASTKSSVSIDVYACVQEEMREKSHSSRGTKRDF